MSAPTLRLGGLPPVRVSGGTLLTVALLAALVYPNLVARGAAGPRGAMVLALAVGVFVIVSVLLHELAHAVLARAFGGHVEQIALTLWGGHTRYRAGAMGPWASVVISLGGPLANALIALAMQLASPLAAPSPAASAFVAYAVVLNIGLMLFNLLPGLPMDGGRAVEALLGGVLGRRALGTVITAWIGRLIAVAIVAMPLLRLLRLLRGTGTLDLVLLLWALIIAGTLWHGATAALRGAATARRVEALDPRTLARPVAVLPAGLMIDRLDPAVDPRSVLLVPAGPHDGGATAHRLDLAALASVPADRRARTPLAAVAGPPQPLVALRATVSGDALVSALIEHPGALAVLLDDDDAPVGVMSSDDVGARLRDA